MYPDTLEEIDEMIHDEKARIECQYQSNPQVECKYCYITGNQSNTPNVGGDRPQSQPVTHLSALSINLLPCKEDSLDALNIFILCIFSGD